MGVHIPFGRFRKVFCYWNFVLPSYYNHNVSFRCNGHCRSLSLFCSITDSVHNTIIVTFFSKEFQLYVEICCSYMSSRDTMQSFRLLFYKVFCLFREFQNGNQVPDTSRRSPLLPGASGLPQRSHDTLQLLFSSTIRWIFSQRAGGINAFQTVPSMMS